jgi:hypothetical protein
LPEVDVDFFVANGRSSQLICPPRPGECPVIVRFWTCQVQKKRPDISRTWTRDQRLILTDSAISDLSRPNTRTPNGPAGCSDPPGGLRLSAVSDSPVERNACLTNSDPVCKYLIGSRTVNKVSAS